MVSFGNSTKDTGGIEVGIIVSLEALVKNVSENLSIGRIDGMGGGEDALQR